MSSTILRRLLVVGAAAFVGALVQALPAFGADTFTPNPVNVTLQAGASTNVNKTLHLDALPGAADIIIAIDTTGSMTNAINQAKAQATALCNNVQSTIPGARFAVIDFKDVPDRPATNGVLILTPTFTSSCAVVQTAINTMSASGGGDFAEAYNWVFHDSYSDAVLNASRNPNAVQFLVVLGDAPPHNSPAPTVAPSCGNQPPADAGITSDSEIAGLNANDITLLMIHFSTPVNIPIACYNELTGATGGTAVESGGDLSSEIISQIQAAAAHIDSVNFVVSGACPPVGLVFNPAPPYGPFTAPVNIPFVETITAPTVPGVYACQVTAVVDGTPRAVQQLNVTVTPGNPATLTLAPKTATNPVDTTHCVTATVKDAFNNPTPNIIVRFKVTGAVNTTGNATTNAVGQAQFCYVGPALPGVDAISAFADTNSNSTQDTGEPSDIAAKTWVVPTSTAGCKVTNGGRITARNGDKATFGGNAMADGLQGEEEYQDHGPAQDMNVHSIDITAVVCNDARTTASIFGTATVDGAGSFDFRIDVADNGEPGRSDTYRIRLSNGYDSGTQTLASGGNIQIH
jgi:Mg-chelatase subunit ChlD